MKVLDARSISYAVRFAESRCPLERLLILSDNLARVLAPSNLCVWFQDRICLVVQVDTVGVDLL